MLSAAIAAATTAAGARLATWLQGEMQPVIVTVGAAGFFASLLRRS